MPMPTPINDPFDPRLPHGHRAVRPTVEREAKTESLGGEHGYERRGRSFICVEGDACGRTLLPSSPEYEFLVREEQRMSGDEARHRDEPAHRDEPDALDGLPDARADLDAIGEALEALEDLVPSSEPAKNPKRSFFRRGTEPHSIPVATLAEHAKALRVAFQAAAAKVELRAAAVAAKIRRALDTAAQVQDDAVAKFEIARVEAQTDSARAQEEYDQAAEYRKRAKEQLDRAEELNTLRDDAMRKLNDLRSKIIGLARSLGCTSLTTADEGAALRWLVERGALVKKESAPADPVGDRLILAALLAELEEKARVMRSSSLCEEREVLVLEQVCAEWRERLKI